MLVEDHTLVRAGIRALLQNLPEIEIIHECSSGIEALDRIRTYRPDIVLMDIGLPDMNGLEVTRRVKVDCPDIKIIFLSMYANEEYVLQALQIGASGYLLKDSTMNELELALHAVAAGEAYLSPVISRKVIDNYMGRVKPNPQEVPSTPTEEKKLTPRQEEILCLIAKGLTTKEIAMRLDLSVKTIDAHRTSILKALDIHEIAGLVRYAIRNGLVSAN